MNIGKENLGYDHTCQTYDMSLLSGGKDGISMNKLSNFFWNSNLQVTDEAFFICCFNILSFDSLRMSNFWFYYYVCFIVHGDYVHEHKLRETFIYKNFLRTNYEDVLASMLSEDQSLTDTVGFSCSHFRISLAYFKASSTLSDSSPVTGEM